MKDDLIVRLRLRAKELDHESRIIPGEWTADLLNEAADEIERLREWLLQESIILE